MSPKPLKINKIHKPLRKIFNLWSKQSVKPRQDKYKENVPGHIIIKLLETTENEKTINAAREKKIHLYIGEQL